MLTAIDTSVGWQYDLIVLPFVILFVIGCAVAWANTQGRR